MRRGLGIRGKVLAAFAVPMLVILVAGVYLSVRALHELSAAKSTAVASVGAAREHAVLTVALTVLALIASLVVALWVSRTIVVPLRRLTAAAADVREQLPRLVEQVRVPGEGPQANAPQIPVTSDDEIGRLASAFNAVNQTTFQVAREQAALRGTIAEMFVNVARRDQVLLNRQLSFIDSLERTEENPRALANLYRLDHLATRMRRNAESLLVLAGIDSGRHLRDAMPLSDVVRTASSEIEQYDRIQLDLRADPFMHGFHALPSAHLLAELLENATAFSEPDTPVVVSTDVVGSFVEVRIVDQGLGMSDDELVAANAKIASTSANDTLGAQRLGLFVVGHLARRLGAEVTLRRNTAGPAGTISSVRFPVTAFQSTEAAPLDVHGDTRRDAPAPETVGAGRAPVRTRLKPPDDFDSILLPDVAVDALPTSLPADDTDWTPAVVDPPLGPEAALPTRRPVASSSAWGSGGAARPRTGGVWLPPTSMPAGTWPVRRQPQVEPWTPPDVEPVPAAGAELNEARAWESGALPVAPVAPSVAPVAAPAAVAAPPAAAPAPAVPAAASPAPEVPSMSAWATPVIPSFGDLVGGPEEPEARRRRGHSGRHDERTDTGHVPVAHPAPAAAPPAVPPLSRQSQTAAYQPDVLADEHRLSRRTPTTVPDETQFVGATVDRDPEALRSRYSSFQSGTTRGRHDAGAAAHREDS